MPEENPNVWNVGRAMLDNVESQERSEVPIGPVLMWKNKSTFLDANSNLLSLTPWTLFGLPFVSPGIIPRSVLDHSRDE